MKVIFEKDEIKHITEKSFYNNNYYKILNCGDSLSNFENLVLYQRYDGMLFVQELYNILDNIRDGVPVKKYTKKDILEVIKLFQKFDKFKWHQFLDKKFIVRVDKEGKPCCRTIKTFRVINDDYLDETNKDGEN